MRVLLLGPYPPPHGGVQTHLVALRSFLLKQGVTCDVLNLTRHCQPSTDGIYYPGNALDVLSFLLRRRYDILHLHFGGHLWTRLLGLSLVCCSIPSAKTVMTLHSGGYPSSEAGRSARPSTLRGFVFRRLDGLIGVNRELVAMFHRFGVPPERARMISPHDLSVEPPADALPEPLRSFYAAHRPVLITVGLLEPEYDLPLQIDTLGTIRERFPEAGLVIIGSGSLEQGLRNRIASKSYASHILLCGDVPHAETLRAMQDAHVFLRTTLYDGDSVAVREALHLGVPVIASDNGMRPAGVHLIPPSDARALRTNIAEAVSLPRPAPAPAQPDAANHLATVLHFYEELLEDPSKSIQREKNAT